MLASCAYKVKAPIQAISFIETQILDTTKIRFNGYYNTLDTTIISDERDINYGKKNSDLYKTLYLKVFGITKANYIDEVGTKNNESFICEYYKQIVEWNKEHNQMYLGRYTIKHDSVYSYTPVYITVGAGRKEVVNCNFRGFVKNRDTITDWKIIPPYPEDFTKFVTKINQHLFEPQTLYFVKADAVKCLQME